VVPLYRQRYWWSCSYAVIQMILVAVANRDEIYAAALQSRHLVNEDGDAASIRDLQAALVAAWGDGLDPEGRQSIVDRSTTPFVGRRGRLASVGASEAEMLFVYAGIGASTFSYEGADAASEVLRKVVEYYSVPGPHMPGLLVCGDHVRVVVGALDAPHIRQLVFIDPNWSEPRFEALDRGGLESLARDLEFEMMFLDD